MKSIEEEYKEYIAERLRPDLDHPLPIGPHWDYTGPKFPDPIRIFPSGWAPREQSSDLVTYQLNFEKTLEYVILHLKGVNKLAEALCDYCVFEDGKFFTELCEEISDKQLYEFEYGGVGGNSRECVIDIVEREVQSGLCIIDCYNVKYGSDSSFTLLESYGVHNGEETYFALEPGEEDRGDILRLLQISDTVWHSLGVVSSRECKRSKSGLLSDLEIKEIAKSVKYVFLRAYDAEGYIIWKRGDVKEPLNNSCIHNSSSFLIN